MLYGFLNTVINNSVADKALHQLSNDGFRNVSDAAHGGFNGWQPNLGVPPSTHPATDKNSPYYALTKEIQSELQLTKKKLLLEAQNEQVTFRALSGYETDYLSKTIALKLRDAAVGSDTRLPEYSEDIFSLIKKIPPLSSDVASNLQREIQYVPSNDQQDHKMYDQKLRKMIKPRIEQAIRNGIIEQTVKEALQNINDYHQSPRYDRDFE